MQISDTLQVKICGSPLRCVPHASRRYLALCVGETRVRFDLEAPLRAVVKRSDEGPPGKMQINPTMLRLLSQVRMLPSYLS